MNAGKFDPELEKLRQEVSKPPDLQTLLDNECQKASKVHTGFLFEDVGKELLQNLCLLLSATASGKSYGDWQKFAASLDLLTEQIRCIEYDFRGLQDPTYYVLLAYVQTQKPTLDKVLCALQKINRMDIIQRTAKCFDAFFEAIKNKDMKGGIYEPTALPRAPIVLCPLRRHEIEYSQAITRNVSGSGTGQDNNSTNVKPKYGSIIMLTFAEDGFETAQNVARICRENDPRIGVLILQEQQKHVFDHSEDFIEDCIFQVNYVVPIITEKYLENIHNNTYNHYGNTTLDYKYIRYIFAILRHIYQQDGCKNAKVRCIIADDQVSKVSHIINHPFLQAWFRESQMNEVIKNILLKKM